jgi:hypothetical protein
MYLNKNSIRLRVTFILSRYLLTMCQYTRLKIYFQNFILSVPCTSVSNYLFITTNALHYFSVFLSLNMFRHLQCHLQGCRREIIMCIIFNASNSLSQLILIVSHYHWVSLVFCFVVISLFFIILYFILRLSPIQRF